MTDTVSATGAAGPRARRVAQVVVGALLLLGLGRLAFQASPITDVLELPKVGNVRAAQLADGTPLFLSHFADGSVEVLEAFTPDTGSVIGGLVGWCPASDQFVDPHSGQLFDRQGVRYELSIPARQSRDALAQVVTGPDDDLARRVYERLAGRGDADDPLLVSEERDAAVLPRPGRPELAGTNSLGPPESCRVPRVPMVQPEPSSTSIPRNRILDHSFLAEIIRLPRDGWQVTDGYLLVRPDTSVEWCRVEPVGIPPSCPDAGPVPVDLPITTDLLGGAWAVIGGPLAARVADGVVVEVATLPRSTWRGSSLRGSITYSGTLQEYRLADNLVRVRLAADEDPEACVGRRQAGDRPTVSQFIDPDTGFDIGGRQDVLALAESALTGVEVEVVVDAATCRALSITDRAR